MSISYMKHLVIVYVWFYRNKINTRSYAYICRYIFTHMCKIVFCLIGCVVQIFMICGFYRLLIATPSNSSSDLIAERLLESQVLIPGTLTRLVGFNYMQEGRLPASLLPHCALASMSEVKDNSGKVKNLVMHGYKLCLV